MDQSGLKRFFYAVMKKAVGCRLFLRIDREYVPGQIKLSAYALVDYCGNYGTAGTICRNKRDRMTAA